ncbi:hypothetical protein HNY73_020591 [Argiope bruennichi]|uniref:Uncharacterized protein n=1 Tax=Argiope bruennichi TaxID=94029 RepID=A0A8T0E8K5_ARGBR|nr:hypothetical protein HNY73_020591 [Argiope bruennichi]
MGQPFIPNKYLKGLLESLLCMLLITDVILNVIDLAKRLAISSRRLYKVVMQQSFDQVQNPDGEDRGFELQ